MSRLFFTCAASALALCAGASAQQTSQQFYSASASGSVETVVVTASPLTQDADDTASITSSVSHEDILASGGSSLADALSDVPGVTGSSFAAGASRPVIRGFDSNRVKMMEDGIGSFDVSDIGPDHGVPIDPLAAQSIEVVRGAATLRYGSQAIGGVVNVLNNRVPDTMPEKSGGEVSGAVGSVSNLIQTAASGDIVLDKAALHIDGFYRNAADYDTPDGKMDNSFSRGTGFSLGGSYFLNDTDHVGAAWVQNDAVYGIPNEDSHIVMRQTKFLGRAGFDMGTRVFHELNVSGGYANYSHEEIEDGEVATTFKNKEFDIRAEQILGAIGPLSSSAIGFQAQNRNYEALGEDSGYLHPTVTTSFAGFLFTEAPVTDTLKLQLSGRVEHVHVTGTPASGAYTERDFTPLSVAVSGLYDVTDWLRFGLTASSTARAPAQTELFARGGHDGPGTFETGDPTLKIERSNSLEASFRVRMDRFTFNGSLWSSWFHNYIYGALTGEMCDDDGVCSTGGDGDLKELNYDQSGAHFRGLEAKGSYELAKLSAGTLSVDAQADYVRATLNHNNGNVPRIPPYHIGGGLSWQAESYDVGFLALYAGKQTDYGAYDSATPSYVDVSAHAAWRPFASDHGFEIVLSGHNLTDDVQRNAVAFNKDEVELPGRDVRLVLRQAF